MEWIDGENCDSGSDGDDYDDDGGDNDRKPNVDLVTL